MANINNSTHDGFVQSKIFAQLFSAGMEMSSFLQDTDFKTPQHNEIARKLVKDWQNALKNTRIIHLKSRSKVGFTNRQIELISELIDIGGKMAHLLDINNELFKKWHNTLYHYALNDSE